MNLLLFPLLATLASPLPTAVYLSIKIDPAPKSQILDNPFERLGKESKFNCKEFGEESCSQGLLLCVLVVLPKTLIAVKTLKSL